MGGVCSLLVTIPSMSRLLGTLGFESKVMNCCGDPSTSQHRGSSKSCWILVGKVFEGQEVIPIEGLRIPLHGQVSHPAHIKHGVGNLDSIGSRGDRSVGREWTHIAIGHLKNLVAIRREGVLEILRTEHGCPGPCAIPGRRFEQVVLGKGEDIIVIERLVARRSRIVAHQTIASVAGRLPHGKIGNDRLGIVGCPVENILLRQALPHAQGFAEIQDDLGLHPANHIRVIQAQREFILQIKPSLELEMSWATIPSSASLPPWWRLQGGMLFLSMA